MCQTKKFFQMQKDGSITVEAACKQMGISKSQWYVLVRRGA
nr:MAG TPA: excisionase [Caudoviricetes sp.]